MLKSFLNTLLQETRFFIGKLFLVDQGALDGSDPPISYIICLFA